MGAKKPAMGPGRKAALGKEDAELAQKPKVAEPKIRQQSGIKIERRQQKNG